MHRKLIFIYSVFTELYDFLKEILNKIGITAIEPIAISEVNGLKITSAMVKMEMFVVAFSESGLDRTLNV